MMRLYQKKINNSSVQIKPLEKRNQVLDKKEQKSIIKKRSIELRFFIMQLFMPSSSFS